MVDESEEISLMPYVGQKVSLNNRPGTLVALTDKVEVIQYDSDDEPNATVIARTGPGLTLEANIEIMAVLRSCGILRSKYSPPGLEFDHVIGLTSAEAPRPRNIYR
jgi:hypothetical protein